MRHLKLILIEQDGRNVSYAKFWPQLQSRGFVRVWRSHAWYSPQIVHSAWLRGVAAGSNAACEAHTSCAALDESSARQTQHLINACRSVVCDAVRGGTPGVCRSCDKYQCEIHRWRAGAR